MNHNRLPGRGLWLLAEESYAEQGEKGKDHDWTRQGSSLQGSEKIKRNMNTLSVGNMQWSRGCQGIVGTTVGTLWAFLRFSVVGECELTTLISSPYN
jgi:hypothetical protein